MLRENRVTYRNEWRPNLSVISAAFIALGKSWNDEIKEALIQRVINCNLLSKVANYKRWNFHASVAEQQNFDTIIARRLSSSFQNSELKVFWNHWLIMWHTLMIIEACNEPVYWQKLEELRLLIHLRPTSSSILHELHQHAHDRYCQRQR